MILYLKEVFRAEDKEKILFEPRRGEFIFSRSEETNQLLLQRVSPEQDRISRASFDATQTTKRRK